MWKCECGVYNEYIDIFCRKCDKQRSENQIPSSGKLKIDWNLKKEGSFRKWEIYRPNAKNIGEHLFTGVSIALPSHDSRIEGQILRPIFNVHVSQPFGHQAFRDSKCEFFQQVCTYFFHSHEHEH